MIAENTGNTADDYTDLRWDNIVTPIKVERLRYWLDRTNYDGEKTDYLIQRFTRGFDIGYRGPTVRKSSSQNIPLTVGTKLDIWTKVIQEVRLGRYAGPFKEIPFTSYIQSPIGLVPKGNNQTRLIFHLSFDFGEKEEDKSLNFHTPEDCSSVKYKDLDYAVQARLRLREISGWDNNLED